MPKNNIEQTKANKALVIKKNIPHGLCLWGIFLHTFQYINNIEKIQVILQKEFFHAGKHVPHSFPAFLIFFHTFIAMSILRLILDVGLPNMEFFSSIRILRSFRTEATLLKQKPPTHISASPSIFSQTLYAMAFALFYIFSWFLLPSFEITPHHVTYFI